MPDAAAEPERTDAFSLALLSVIRVLRSVAAGLINLMFPYLVLVELGYGEIVIGLVYTVATLATALLGLSVGIAADLLGRKRTFLFGLATLPASTAILLVSRGLPAIFVAAAVGGYSATGSLAGGGVGGIIQPIQSAIMTDLTARRDRTYFFGLLAFLAGVSAAAGAFLAGFLSTTTILAIATVLGTVSTVLAVFVRTRPHVPPGLRLRTGKVIGQFSLTGMLNGASQGLVAPFLIPFFILVYKIPESSMAPWTAASGLIASFALLASPYLERALGFLKSVYATRGTTIALALLFPVIPLLPVSLGLYMTFPAFRVMAVPVQQAAMMDMVDGQERGRALGINQATRLGASSAGTAFTGYEFAVDLLYLPFAAYALVMAGNLYLYHSFFRGYETPAAAAK